MTHLRDLGRWSGGNTPSKANIEYWTNGTVPWVSPKDMKFDEITRSEDLISQSALAEGRVSLLPTGSVLIVTRSGILSHTLPVAVTKLPVTINQDIKALTLNTGVSAKYVAHALRGSSQRILRQCSKHGTTVASVDTNALLDFEIPMVGFDEQEAVVAELEKQFSRLDEAVANLQRVKANLKRYKASVLKAAVEGRLVETEASLAHREGRNYETGTQLLQRILEFRRSNLSAKGKFKEPAESKTTDQSELPEGWARGTFGHLCQVQGGFAFKSNSYQPNGVPLVRISNLVNGVVKVGDNTVYLSEEFLKRFSDFRLQKGDTLIAMSGATTGKMATYTLDDSALLNQRVGRFRPVAASLLDAGYISLLAMQAGGKVLSDAYGAAQPNISPTEIEAIPVGVPPFSEQTRIVAEVDRHLSIIREVESEVDNNLKRAQALRQATLTQAFSSKLPVQGNQ